MYLGFQLTFLALLTTFSVHVWAAKCWRTIRGEAQFSLDIWRYYGESNFQSAQHAHLGFGNYGYRPYILGRALSNGGYAGQGHTLTAQIEDRNHANRFLNPLREELESGSQGNTLLQRNQFFPLALMRKVNYIDGQIQEEQAKIEERLQTAQTTFFEVLQSRTRESLIQEFGEVPKTARREALGSAISKYMSMFDGYGVPDPMRELFQLKVGAAWLISANGVNQSLPLESPNLEKAIDRELCKHIWEIGRAAETHEQAFDEALKAMAHFVYLDILIQGLDLYKACIFGHSLGAMHTRHYKIKFGMSEHSGYRGKPLEKALMVGIPSLIDRFPLTGFSDNIAELHSLANRSLTPKQAFDLYFKVRQNNDYFLENSAGAAIHIRDFSPLKNVRIEHATAKIYAREGMQSKIATRLSQAGPTTQFRDSIGDYAYGSSYPYVIPVSGTREPDPKLADKSGMMKLRSFLHDNRAIEIHAHNEAARKLSVRELVAAAYKELCDQLRAEGLANPESLLRELDVNFAVTMNHGDLMMRAQAENILAKWYVYREETTTLRRLGFGSSYREVIRPRINAESLVFSASQASVWAADPSVGAFAKGRVHRDEYLSKPVFWGP